MQQLILVSATFIVAILMLYPSGVSSFNHFKDAVGVLGMEEKVRHGVMGLFFLTIFALSSYVAFENAKKFKEEEKK